MSARISKSIDKWTDKDVENEIQRVQDVVKSWLNQHELWYDCGFKSQLKADGCEPIEDEPIVMYFWAEAAFSKLVYGDLESEFAELLAALGYWYSHEKALCLALRANDDDLARRFYDYFHWQWTCSLLVPDTGDVYDELYAYFARFPEKLHSLNWRAFEVLLFRIFQNHGYKALLGPGRNDGGVDIRLWQEGPLGDMLTVVQAKKYRQKIDLQPVQALYGAGQADKAHNALFVTTSSYTPAAQKFAGRVSEVLELYEKKDIIAWCDKAKNGVIRDKSTLVCFENVQRLVAELRHHPDDRVVHAVWGFNMTHNSYALVIKETKHAALMLSLGSRSASGDDRGQVGTEIPLLDATALTHFNADGVFRATRKVDEQGRPSYWDGSNLYTPWDRKPNSYDYFD